MARDKYHYVFKKALEADGWTITDDPFYLDLLTTTLEVDLGAERLIAATKGTEQIAIEIKSFIGLSHISEFYKALGQFLFYFMALENDEPDRTLFLAIPKQAYLELIKEPLTTKTVIRHGLKLVIYDVEQKQIVEWIK